MPESIARAARRAGTVYGPTAVRAPPPEDAVSMGIGATLREAREGQGRSLEDAAAQVRARASQLEALEDERFGDFGGDVYARGFLRSYAAELGLDPAPLLEIYRREVEHDVASPMNLTTSIKVGAPSRQRTAPPAWMAWVLVTVVVLAGVALVGSLDIDGARTPDQASPAEPPPAPAPSQQDETEEDVEGSGSAGTDETGDPDDPEDPDAPAPAPEPEPEPEPDGVELVIALEADSWMRVVVDGSMVLEQVVEAGQTLPFEGDREIEIRFGNAGGVRANLNGEDLGVQGSSGQAITVRYTQDGFEEA